MRKIKYGGPDRPNSLHFLLSKFLLLIGKKSHGSNLCGVFGTVVRTEVLLCSCLGIH